MMIVMYQIDQSGKIEDTARDSVRMIQIWQGKELTLIGPPASLGQRTDKEFFLGS